MSNPKIVAAALTAASLAAPAAAQATSPAQHARQEVRTAQKRGPRAVRRLAANVQRRTAHSASGAQTGPTPAQQALAVAMYQAGGVTETVTPSPVGEPAFSSDMAVAASTKCRGPAKSYWSHSIAGGATVASLTETNPSWCGNGSSITFGHDNWQHKPWSNYPYCLTSVSTHQGWDKYPAWAHGGMWATTGVYTIALVCAPILGSEHTTLRVAANGYRDHADDFGF